jgi:lipopolysaccharide/colanic/teichoic acid biosynthesis glycosyltransferase
MPLSSHIPEPETIVTPVSSIPAFLHTHPASSAFEGRIKSPSASNWSLSRARRILDIAVALLVLTCSALPMLAIAVCIRLSSSGPAIFVQKRVGRKGRLFRIYKFRSMTSENNSGPGLTKDGDCRITFVGRWLRKLKLDELPQFYNILRGDMSLVGPRPKLPQYAAILNMPYRPGITGPATLAFRHEERLLRCIHPGQMESFYHHRIKPLKARIDARYMCRATFWTDMRIVAATFLACVMPARLPTILRSTSLRLLAVQPLSSLERRINESYGTPG